MHKMLYYMSWTQIIPSKIKLQNTALQPDLSSRSTLVMCFACSQGVINLNKTRLLSGSQNITILMDRSASGFCSDFWHPESKQNSEQVSIEMTNQVAERCFATLFLMELFVFSSYSKAFCASWWTSFLESKIFTPDSSRLQRGSAKGSGSLWNHKKFVTLSESMPGLSRLANQTFKK